MGTCSLCINDVRFKGGEFKSEPTISDVTYDVANIVNLQSVLRGYLQRKKLVEHSPIRYKSPKKHKKRKSKGY